MNPIVMKAAEAVRKEVEVWAGKNRSEFYGSINPDNLMGACAISSFLLYRTLLRMGIHAKVVEGRYEQDSMASWFEEVICGCQPAECNHCWVEYRGHIIDVTATQFGVEDKIYLTSAKNPYYKAVRKGSEAYTDLLLRWGPKQNPQTYQSAMNSILRKATKEIRK